MEELNFLESIIILSLTLCLLVNAISPPLMFLLSKLLEFWKRLPSDTYEWAYKYQKRKYRKLLDCFNEDLALGTYVVFDVIFSALALKCLVEITNEGYLLHTTIIMVIIAGLIFIPRFIIDVCKTLKYKPKTGESETIEKLKEDVRFLKQQVDKQKD